MALMLLPHWTDGCIASMEGLFFEASGTTPYHFLTAAAMSRAAPRTRCASCATSNNDADVGVRHLQALGVRYVMMLATPPRRPAQKPTSKPDLTHVIAESYPWNIYQRRGTPTWSSR
jgi:hypothetical protein